MIYFLFGFCFCLSLDRIIEWFQIRFYDRRNNRSYLRYHNYNETDYRNLDETWRIHTIRSRLSNLECQWDEFKKKYPYMFEEEKEEEKDEEEV